MFLVPSEKQKQETLYLKFHLTP